MYEASFAPEFRHGGQLPGDPQTQLLPYHLKPSMLTA